MSKRKRDPTFIASEKEALLEIVERHFSIVESKKTDAVSMKNKTEEWRKIATEFNAISSIHPRDWTVLKNSWENIKKRAKHEQTLRNQHFLGTGGGPPKKPTEDTITNRVLELIQDRVPGFVNRFDSDGTHILASTHDTSPAELSLCNSDSVSQLQIDNSEPIATTSTETTTTCTVDWSQYNPSMLREIKNPALGRSPSPSPDVHQIFDTQEHQTPWTPQRGHTACVAAVGATTTSRRRPIYRRETEARRRRRSK